MYTAEELYSKDDWIEIRNHVMNRDEFEFGIEPAPRGHVRIDGRVLEDEDLINNIWRGKDYLVSFDEWHNIHATPSYPYANIGGMGFATEKLEWLDTWESFCDYLDEHVLYHIPGYKKPETFQMTLF